MKYIRTAILALTGGLLSACVLPPKDAPREQVLAVGQLGLGAAAAPAPGAEWWRAYHDPQLDELVRQALASNPSLAQAMARVREAQALADVAHAGLLPSVSYDFKDTRQRFSTNDIVPPPFGGGVYWEGQQGVNLNWDLDFWGRQSAQLRQARSQTAAVQLDVASARLALAGAVAQAYIDLYRHHALAEVAHRTEEQRLHILDITRKRVDAGLDTNVELREAEGAVPQAHVELSQEQAAIALAVHQLAALSGRGADAYAGIRKPRLDIETALPLPAQLPADLLGRRPDVLAARSRVEAATAGSAAAKAAFYPDVNLAAFAGTSAIGFTNLFRASSGAYGAGPAVHLPLFEAGRLKAGYRGANAEIDDAIASYNQTVLQAVRQTADQLSNIEALNLQLREQQKALDAAEAAYRLAGERYDAGLSGYLTVLNAETQVLTARRQRVDLLSAQAIARVTLLLALGGSFDPNAPPPVQTASAH
ncbi:MAG TPA: efflux transporter outer membrane subunit [Nevskia sp.]|nr:efflux transporter outer membrane subunit [Nevskia sp.]